MHATMCTGQVPLSLLLAALNVALTEAGEEEENGSSKIKNGVQAKK